MDDMTKALEADWSKKRASDEAAIIADHHARMAVLKPMAELEAMRLAGEGLVGQALKAHTHKYELAAGQRSLGVHNACKKFAEDVLAMRARHVTEENELRIKLQSVEPPSDTPTPEEAR